MIEESIPYTIESVVNAMNENFSRAESNMRSTNQAIQKVYSELNTLKREVESMKINLR